MNIGHVYLYFSCKRHDVIVPIFDSTKVEDVTFHVTG
jgi:hypothetical protein